jgi:anti-sigma-K factor RskA
MNCQEFNFVRFVMAAPARAVREHTHRMWDGSTTCERVQVIAPTPAVAQIEVVVVVTELYPSHRRSTPPFLVPEVDLVGEARFTLLARDEQVNHELANASVSAEVMEVDPTETIEAHP